jgi:hypothetical protein
MNTDIRANYKGREVTLDHCIIEEEYFGDDRYSIVPPIEEDDQGQRILVEKRPRRNRCYAFVRDKEGRMEKVPMKKLEFIYDKKR